MAIVGEAVTTTALSRLFRRKGGGPVTALAEVDLSIACGEARGLLGPNGAGKTTLVRILSTALLPTAGSALVLGMDVVSSYVDIRRRIAVVFGGDRGLFGNLTVAETLAYWAALYAVPRKTAAHRVSSLLEELDLVSHANSPVSKLSRGTKQRVHLARGLIADPEVLFLDEPTIGMDPVAATAFRQTILRLKSLKKTILLTTHDMAEAAAVCDQVTFIDQGRLLATASPRQIGQIVKAGLAVEFHSDVAIDIAAAGVRGVREARCNPSGVSRIDLSNIQDAGEAASCLVRFLLDHGVRRVAILEPTLEEVYVRLIGGEKRAS